MIITEHSALLGHTNMNLVASAAEEDEFNPKICIIYLEDKFLVTSEKTGRARIKKADKTRNDVVRKNIKSVLGDDEDDQNKGMFVYHNNKNAISLTHILAN